jgi:uncharacterized repeat protein (TIGR01451 family)
MKSSAKNMSVYVIRLARLLSQAAVTLFLVVIVVADVNRYAYFGVAPVSFAPPVTYPLGPDGKGPFSITPIDFNGDGVLDLVVPNRDSANLIQFRGVGDGTFVREPNPLPGGTCPIFAAVGDFNRDGISDLAVINHLCYTLFVMLGYGDGRFTSPTIQSTGMEPRSITVGDFNRDGSDDLAIVNHMSETISIFTGRGDGTFRPRVDYPAGSSPHAIVSADFNGDQLPDLAVANTGTNSVTLFQNVGMGGFRSLPDIPAGLGSTALVATDLNHDQRPDLVVVDVAQNGVSVLLANGPFSFESLRFYPTGSSPFEVRSADFNSDGHQDVVVANRNSETVSVLLGQGDGSFARTSHLNHLALGRSPFDVTVGDFNRDGRIDLATANFVENSISVLLAEEPRFADVVVSAVPSATTVAAGGEITWELQVRNLGPDAAVNVELRNQLPALASLVSCVASDGADCNVVGGEQVVVFPTLAAGGIATVTIVAQAADKICDGDRLVDVARVTARPPDPLIDNNSVESLVEGGNTPPVIAAQPDIDLFNNRPGDRSGIVVDFQLPEVTDNTAGTTVVCRQAPGSIFPVGTTQVVCTATDSCGLTATTTFNVRIWDMLLIDDRSGHVILFDSFTGAYLFRRGDTGQEYPGHGQVTRRGCEVRLTDDKRADVYFNRCLLRAFGIFRPTGSAPVFTINDRYTGNNRL